MYVVMTTARLIREGFTKRELEQALDCCLERIARGRYVARRVCDNPDHSAVWAAIDEAYADEYEHFGDRRDAEERLRVIIHARAEKTAGHADGGRAASGREIFSHLSAALIHGLPVVCLPDPRAEVYRGEIPRKYRHLHVRVDRVPEGHTTSVDIYRVTSVEWTLVDVALTYDLATAVAMIDHAIREGMTNTSRIARVLDGRPEARAQRRARTALDLADGRRESPAESVAAVRFYEFGIVGMEPQVEMFGDAGVCFARVDFCHRASRTIVEVDGLAKYAEYASDAKEALADEKRRDDRLAAMGYRVFRVTWKQLFLAGTFEEIGRIVRERSLAMERNH